MQGPFTIKSNHTFDLSHGFLPKADPIQSLPPAFSAWENLANTLPKYLVSNKLKDALLALPEFNIQKLTTGEQFERAMLILSYIAHAYIWSHGAKPPKSLPQIIAKPWYDISLQLKRPPILSYASYALYNWRRINPNEPIELGNIALLQNFLGGMDEEWFILVHVDIEQKALELLPALIPAQQAAIDKNNTLLIQHLSRIANGLNNMCDTMDRMPEHCDPYIYYNRVRPYIHGWKANPALPEGLIYEGVTAYQNKPQKFKGETGAQSSIIPCLDAALGIFHKESPLRFHLDEMRTYMPPEHLAFLRAIEANPNVRDYALQMQDKKLNDAYNACIKLIDRFRITHLNYAAQYIQKQSQTSDANSTEVGTGGTPFMRYLGEHEEETKQQIID